MDHKWGRNVYQFGLMDTGASLASCFLGHPELIITNAKVPFPGTQCVVWVLLNTGLYSGPGYLGIVGSHRRFPYGFGVEPDVPL